MQVPDPLHDEGVRSVTHVPSFHSLGLFATGWCLWLFLPSPLCLLQARSKYKHTRRLATPLPVLSYLQSMLVSWLLIFPATSLPLCLPALIASLVSSQIHASRTPSPPPLSLPTPQGRFPASFFSVPSSCPVVLSLLQACGKRKCVVHSLLITPSPFRAPRMPAKRMGACNPSPPYSYFPSLFPPGL